VLAIPRIKGPSGPFFCAALAGRPPRAGDPQSAAGRRTSDPKGEGAEHARAQDMQGRRTCEGAGPASDRPASRGAGYARDRPASRGAGIYINIYRLAGAQAWRDAAGDAAGETANKILVMLARPV